MTKMTEAINHVRSVMDEAHKNKYLVYCPDPPENATGGLYKPVVTYVWLSPDPDRGEIYNEKKAKKYLPTATGWEKLIQAAGIDWDPTSGRVDDRKNLDFCEYCSRGCVLLADGRHLIVSAHYSISVGIEKIEILRRNLAREKKGRSQKEHEAWAQQQSEKEIIELRKKSSKLCETRSRVRTGKTLMRVFSKGYATKEEYSQKPFVVVRYILDSSQPDLRNLLMQKAVANTMGFWGGPAQSAPALPARPHLEVVEAQVVEDEETFSAAPDPEGHEGLTSHEADLMALTPEERSGILEPLMVRKGFSSDELQCPLSEHTPELALSLFRHLHTLPDASMEGEE